MKCPSFPPLRDPAILDGLDLTEEERNVLIDNINRRLTPQAVKIRAGETPRPLSGVDKRCTTKLCNPFHISCIYQRICDPSVDIEVACYGYEGIDAVKEALRAGLGCSTEVMPIKVSLHKNV